MRTRPIRGPGKAIAYAVAAAPRAATRSGLTLIEALVVVAIIGVLSGMLLGVVQRARTAALRTECADHLRQIGIALHGYHDSYNVLPPGCSYRGGIDPYPFMSWCTRILPFLEHQDLWQDAQRAYREDPWFLHNPPHTDLSTVIPTLLCPADSRTHTDARSSIAFTSYLGVEGVSQVSHDGVLFLDSTINFAMVADGTSQTIMVGERPPSAYDNLGWWYAGWGQSQDGSGDMDLSVNEVNAYGYGGAPLCPPGPYQFRPGQLTNQCDAFHFWSLHSGGAHFLFVDGSVHFLSYSVEPIMKALSTRAGGETVVLP